jgi:hypothetical protein
LRHGNNNYFKFEKSGQRLYAATQKVYNEYRRLATSLGGHDANQHQRAIIDCQSGLDRQVQTRLPRRRL